MRAPVKAPLQTKGVNVERLENSLGLALYKKYPGERSDLDHEELKGFSAERPAIAPWQFRGAM